MRAALYTVVFVGVGIPAVVMALDYATYTAARVSVKTLFPQIGFFNLSPSRALWTPGDYADFGFSLALGALAIRRLVLMFRTGHFTPDHFRGVSYVAAWIGLICALTASMVYVLTEGSLVLALIAFMPAPWAFWLAFVIPEVTSIMRKGVPVRPNSTVETDAREDSARGSL
jgi:hypothetical protein